MEFDQVVNDVKARFEDVSKKAQATADVAADVAKKANGVIADGAKAIADDTSSAAKSVYGNAVESFNKAREAGVKEVANNPVSFLPEGKDQIVATYNGSVEKLNKTVEGLNKVLTEGYSSARVSLGIDAPAPKKKAPAKKAAAKKPAAKATAAKKPAAKKAPAKKAAA